MGYFNIRNYLCSLLLHIVEHWTDSSGIRPLRLLHVFIFLFLFSNGKLSNESIDISFRLINVFCISEIIKIMVVGFMYLTILFRCFSCISEEYFFCYLNIIKMIFAEVNTIVR